MEIKTVNESMNRQSGDDIYFNDLLKFYLENFTPIKPRQFFPNECQNANVGCWLFYSLQIYVNYMFKRQKGGSHYYIVCEMGQRADYL